MIMRDAILLNHDSTMQQFCSTKLAQQLLQLGLARIIKFYPYTVQFKGSRDNDGKEGALVTTTPLAPQPATAKQKLFQKPITLEKMYE